MECLNLFIEDSKVFGDEECFGDLSYRPGLNGGNQGGGGWVFVSNEHTDKCRPLGYGFQASLV